MEFQEGIFFSVVQKHGRECRMICGGVWNEDLQKDLCRHFLFDSVACHAVQSLSLRTQCLSPVSQPTYRAWCLEG